MSSPFFFDPTNLLVLPEMIIGAFVRGDWKRAYKRAGTIGIIAEFAGAATGLNTVAFFVPTNSRLVHVDGVGMLEVGNPHGYWNQGRVRSLLLKYGVKSWAFGYWFREMHFSVEKRQGHWAQYVMLREGVPLLHGLIPGSRAIPKTRRMG